MDMNIYNFLITSWKFNPVLSVWDGLKETEASQSYNEHSKLVISAINAS